MDDLDILCHLLHGRRLDDTRHFIVVVLLFICWAWKFEMISSFMEVSCMLGFPLFRKVIGW